MYLKKEPLRSLLTVLILTMFSVNMPASDNSLDHQNTIFAISSIVNEAMDDENRVNHEINLAGKQRMLTQKMSKETILIALNVEPEKNRKLLKKTSAMFDSFERIARLRALPASPLGKNITSTLFSFSNFVMTSSLTANESWVKTTNEAGSPLQAEASKIPTIKVIKIFFFFIIHSSFVSFLLCMQISSPV